MDQQRTETGPVQFGDDWPGVFIRGDNTLNYALLLRNLIQRLEQDPDYKREAFEGIFQLAVLRDLRIRSLSVCIFMPSDNFVEQLGCKPRMPSTSTTQI